MFYSYRELFLIRLFRPSWQLNLVASALQRTKGQLKFPARGEELALERVVGVVVHAKQQIRIVTQTVSVADVPAMK